MLIQNDTFRNVYVADGNTTTFAYTTPILDETWLAIYRQIPGGEQERVTNSEYSLTGVGNPNAGNVIFSTAPADGTRLTFILDVPISQLHKYAELDNFPAESHEDALAKLTLICQMLSEKLSRAVVTLETSEETPEELRDGLFAARDAAAASATAASDSALEASDSAALAQAWAESSTSPDSEDLDSKSAKTWAGLAADSANDAATSESNAAGSADRAQAWAESSTPPDPEDPDSKSAKTWAAIAADTVPIATPELAGKVKPDGTTIEVTQDGTISAPGLPRNVGELVYSIVPLTDASLHLLDGSLLSATGIYAAGIAKIAALQTDYPNLFVTEAAWQQSVATYGVCGKFVYDSTNNTLRLPKVTGFMEATIDATALGNLVEAGLPNITGEISALSGYISGRYTSAQMTEYNTVVNSGALKVTSSQLDAVYTSQAMSGYTAGSGCAIDASESNPIYGNSGTVQPQAIKGFVYIVLANTVKTQIAVDIDEIATDLNGKADVDLANCTKPHVVETWHSGTEWYRVWSDGWIEQGGILLKTAAQLQVNLLKSFADANYSVNYSYIYSIQLNGGNPPVTLSTKTTSSFTVSSNTYSVNSDFYLNWVACGY